MSVDRINDILPQTQCTLCGYSGCKPYAKAIIDDNESIDKCLPGGLQTAQSIAALTSQQLPDHLDEFKKPNTKVRIDPNECIGCTKCIQACPVNAIVGGPRLMHDIISDLCTGCDLCIPHCPVDCMEVVSSNASLPDPDYLKLQHNLKLNADEKQKNRRSSRIQVTKERTSQQTMSLIELAIQKAKERKGHTIEES